MPKARALLPALLLSAAVLTGCMSLDDYLNKVGTVHLYAVGNERTGDLKDFRTLEIVFEGFAVRDLTFGASDTPLYKEVGTTVDLANTGGVAQIYEAKYATGRWNMTSMTVKVKNAVLKDGTK
ncbi:MAG TPA: hypothetical protein VNZ52_13155, partial [Candidatus Thermoplasmatota archaeon]|nr:hypothetical protein [Candidatus Thermoplasmatota archaeon]